jgi:glucan biosynthesis protein C
VDHSTSQSMGTATAQSPTVRPSRLFFVDHLRVALVILVVLHHVAAVYGGTVPFFYYVEPPINEPLAGLVLLAFQLFNQAWFMGALFLLAGYFTPGSFDRKGSGSFLKDRLLRLGIPLLIFYFVLGPISFLGWWQMPATLTGLTTPLTWQSYWQMYPILMGMGPLWFVAMLLVFSFGYAGWRVLARNRTSSPGSESPLPGYLAIGVFILALALASYLVRFVIPIGKSVLDFPTLAYFPQYLSFFVIGAVASRRNWLQTLPRSKGIVGLVAALLVSVVLLPVLYISLLMAIENASPQLPPFGYGTWQSALSGTLPLPSVCAWARLYSSAASSAGKGGSAGSSPNIATRSTSSIFRSLCLSPSR